MMKLIIGLFIFIGFSFAGISQNLNDFEELKASGEIPDDFTKLSLEKFNDDYGKNKDEDLDKEFFLNSRFYTDELLLSGKILFNDPLSDYLDKVAKNVLRRDKELYKRLRFYVIKSTAVNAFSTDQGVMLFTSGLLSQVENEAQLAYIVAHEVSHYTEKHLREGYIERQNYRNSRGRYKRVSYDDAVNQLSVYDKGTELEADKKGIDIYLKSQYATEEVFTAFEVLLYSYLPFEERIFDTAYLNTKNMIIPGNFFSDTINRITLEEDYDDYNSTHPNIKTRIDEAIDYIGEKESRGEKKFFVVDEEKFKKLRALARFETINLHLSNRNYAQVLYEIFVLQQDYKDNRFLDLSLVKAIYGLAKYKNHGRYNEVTEKLKKVEGESYVLHKFLKDISRSQLNVIVFRHLYDMKMKYPNDPIFDDYFIDMKKEFALRGKVKFDDLKGQNFQDYIAELDSNLMSFDIEDSIAKVDESDLSKYKKIRLKKKLRAMMIEGETLLYEKDFHLFALHDLVARQDLIADLKKLKRLEEKLIEQKDSINRTEARERRRQGYHLGIKKLMVIDPIYEDYKLNDKRNHLKSEKKKISVADFYSDDYRNLDLETKVLDSKFLSSGDLDQYNELGLIKTWMSEVLDHDDIDMISSTRDRMRDVVDKYGTSKFLFSGIYGFKERAQLNMWHLYGILLVYTAPFALADLLIVHNFFQLVAFEIDAISDEIEFMQADEIKLKGIKKILRVYIYDVLYQLNSIKH